jgi:hypothetical protein
MNSNANAVAQSNGKKHLALAELDNLNNVDIEQEMPPTKDDRLYELLERRFDEDRRRFEEDKRQAEDRHKELMLTISNGGGRRPPAWASFALSLVALLGVGINIGVYVSKAQQQEQATTQLREDYNRVNSRFEKMRDLYMVQFGADPEDPNTKAIVKRGK